MLGVHREHNKTSSTSYSPFLPSSLSLSLFLIIFLSFPPSFVPTFLIWEEGRKKRVKVELFVLTKYWQEGRNWIEKDEERERKKKDGEEREESREEEVDFITWFIFNRSENRLSYKSILLSLPLLSPLPVSSSFVSSSFPLAVEEQEEKRSEKDRKGKKEEKRNSLTYPRQPWKGARRQH